ncbi:MAG TPA: hypothetical protein VKW06_02790 [Candidatus Angelobacter sp.]|nr:hypothetical protein [Candidatus Angelobacter sp.]
MFTFFQIGFFLLGVVFLVMRPGSGTAVGCLGLLALIVTIQGQMSDREKLIWIIAGFLLLIVEIVAIRRDRDESETKRIAAIAAETASFSRILQQEQAHFETTMSHFETLEGTRQSEQAVNVHLAQPSVTEHPKSLRTRGLLLSRDIYHWLEGRLRGTPQITGDAATKYRGDTFRQFESKFGGSLIEVRDELATRGLQDLGLDLIASGNASCYGDCDRIIKAGADSLSKLSLAASEQTCSNLDDAKLIARALSLAKEMASLALSAESDIVDASRRGQNTRWARQRLTSNFDKCCWGEVSCVRNQLNKRLGPNFRTAEEEQAWERLYTRFGDGTVDPDALKAYSPLLEQGAKLLKQQMR